MCGLTGFWSERPLTADTARRWLLQMGGALVHRGPDDSDISFDVATGVGLSHRRLSIVDLSDHGRQPMRSHTGRYTIAYNGEIYNAPEIRSRLDSEADQRWRGHSDTETLLGAIEAWGLQSAIEAANGMFAFALWDEQQKTMSLARDRLGIKPLSYATGDYGLAFGSELSAFRGFEPFVAKLDRVTLAAYFKWGVVPQTRSILKGVRKVPPGSIVRFASATERGAVQHYWSAERCAESGLADPFVGDDQAAVDALERVVSDAVRIRMRADVPFGAFLSGGIDSSSVVALMQSHSDRPVRTFCVGNEGADYDESRYAAKIAKHLGCDHTDIVASAESVIDLIPTIAHRWDEPFADSSQLPTFMVSELARRHVKVSLSGDGGDELFAGYNRHLWAPRIWNAAQRIPDGLRKHATLLKRVPVDRWDALFEASPLGGSVRLPGDKIHKLASVGEASSEAAFYTQLRTCWREPERLVVGSQSAFGDSAFTRVGDFAQSMMLTDLLTYLPDDILTKVDRASMAVSLEARVPLLDHRVVELSMQLPIRLKIKEGVGKWALRQVLSRHVPPAMFDRPKTGFGVPVGQWLAGPLSDWSADLLSTSRLRADQILDPAPVSETVEAHRAGRGQHEHKLWSLLMFQSWWEANRHWVES